jgi:hypothetical protein
LVPACSSTVPNVEGDTALARFRIRLTIRILAAFAFFDGSVHGDACEPSRKPRIFPELIQVPKSLYERVLHGFFGTFDVPEDCQCHTEYPPLMASHRRFERSPVSRQNAIHEH